MFGCAAHGYHDVTTSDDAHARARDASGRWRFHPWGSRQPQELAAQQALFPDEALLPFDIAQAEVAARLYSSVRQARARSVDLAIAAHAISRDAESWTLDPADLADIPGILLVDAA